MHGYLIERTAWLYMYGYVPMYVHIVEKKTNDQDKHNNANDATTDDEFFFFFFF